MIRDALAAAGSELRATFSRVHRLLRGRAHWERHARRHPPLGIEPAELERALEAVLRDGPEHAGDPDPERMTPLPGLRSSRAATFYARHWLRGPEEPLAVASHPEIRARAWSLAIVPHRDDAALALGGTIYARRHEERTLVADVFTVSVWLGEGLRPRSLRHVTALRAREEALSLSVLGARGVALGFWDVDCRSFQRAACDGYRIPEGFRWRVDPALRPEAERDAMAQALLEITRRVEPARIYVPLGAGGHADHVLLRELCFALRSRFRELAPRAAIYGYEDQPYSTYAKVDVEGLARTLAPDATPELVDVTAAFERKMQAIAAHRSQFRRDENEPRLRSYAARLARGLSGDTSILAERLWRLR